MVGSLLSWCTADEGKIPNSFTAMVPGGLKLTYDIRVLFVMRYFYYTFPNHKTI